MSKTTNLMVWDIPTEVKGKFKAACAARGISMKDALITFMESFATALAELEKLTKTTKKTSEAMVESGKAVTRAKVIIEGGK